MTESEAKYVIKLATEHGYFLVNSYFIDIGNVLNLLFNQPLNGEFFEEFFVVMFEENIKFKNESDLEERAYDDDFEQNFKGGYRFYSLSDFLKFLISKNKITEEEAVMLMLQF